ncbi:MAG: hypothetical protein ABSC92_08880, partial [Rhizomicrobium sp.]
TLNIEEKYRNRLLVVEYERLFSGDAGVLKSILKKLNLALPNSLLRQFQGMTRDWETRSQKPLNEREGQEDFIRANADMKGYAKLKRLAVQGIAEAHDVLLPGNPDLSPKRNNDRDFR